MAHEVLTQENETSIVEARNLTDLNDWTVDLMKQEALDNEAPSEDEVKAVPASEILRGDEHYKITVATLDIISAIGERADKVASETLPAGQDNLKYFMDQAQASRNRLKNSHDWKGEEITIAAENAHTTIDAPIQAMNSVVDVYKNQCRDVSDKTAQIYGQYETSLQKLHATLETLHEEYTQLMIQSVSVSERVHAHKDISDGYSEKLVVLRDDFLELQKRREECNDRITEISRILHIRKKSDAEQIGDADQPSDELLTERRSLRATISQINDVKEQAIYDEILEVQTLIQENGKASNALYEEDKALRDRAREIVAKAQQVTDEIVEVETNGIAAISNISIVEAPDILNDGYVAAMIVKSNPKKALETLNRTNAEMVGAAAAKNDIAARHFVESAASDKKRFPEVLSRMVGSHEARVYDEDMLKDILGRNGIKFPDNEPLLPLLKDFCTFVEQRNAEQPRKPQSLGGGATHTRND